MKPLRKRIRDYAIDLVVRGLFWVGMRLPYATRVRLLGWIGSRILAPLAGFHRRIRNNLALVCPDLPPAEVRRLTRAVPDNAVRTLVEIFSGEEFARVARSSPIRGAEGLAAIEAAQDAGRPVMLVSGHFGNYDVVRAVMAGRGRPVGGLYNPMSNPHFNARYVAAITQIGRPVFPRGRRGLAEMLRHLRAGGMLGILVDQRMPHGAPLKFFGKTAYTALSTAEMALKYNALVVPVYGRRLADGLSFELIVEPPLQPGTPEEMTQALNDSLEAQVRAHMDQWFWIHRRWRGVGAPEAGSGRPGEAPA